MVVSRADKSLLLLPSVEIRTVISALNGILPKRRRVYNPPGGITFG